MLTEDDLNPPPLFTVFYKGQYLSFFSDYPRALTYVQGHKRAMGEKDYDNYEIKKR
jgi:hypothetical protein